jgi:hypothetical protein
VPHIAVWKATDASDEALRHSLAESLAGLATESQVTIERVVVSPEVSSALCEPGDPPRTLPEAGDSNLAVQARRVPSPPLLIRLAVNPL